jgi:DNA-directed RNA polymerase beta subunit
VYQPNQIHPDFLGAISLNPWQQHTSSSRSAMISNHVGQMLVINGSTERFCQTGMEREYAKYTFAIKMPCNGEIIEIIERYKKTLGKDSIDENPQTILVYEDVETKQIGIVNLLTYCSNHQYFGFQYKTAEGLQQLRVGAFIKKDTIFLNSPSVTPEGGYKYGLQANVAYMTHPATSEDSVVISQSLLPKLGFGNRL